MTGFDFCHQVVAKDKEWGGKRCLYDNVFYPAELKSVFYKDNKPFEGCVHWVDWKKKGDGINIIRWNHIDDNIKCGRCCRNRKPTNRYSPDIISKEQAK